jgi:RNA polymerase sigma-70 factor (ECF subfamily)
MDCPIGTVRSRIFRAREAIDQEMQPLMDSTTTTERASR